MSAIVTCANAFMSQRAVVIDYTNWKGERSRRTIVPLSIRFGANGWHPDSQWLMDAYDVAKEGERTFALLGIHSIEDSEFKRCPL